MSTTLTISAPTFRQPSTASMKGSKKRGKKREYFDWESGAVVIEESDYSEIDEYALRHCKKWRFK